MATYRYNHPHTKHLVLQGAKDAQPYAHFKDGVFETDDPKVIARIRQIDGVEAVEESADADADADE